MCDSIVLVIDGKGEVNPTVKINGLYLKNHIMYWKLPRQLICLPVMKAYLLQLVDNICESSILHYSTLAIRGNWGDRRKVRIKNTD